MPNDQSITALIVVDIQLGFNDKGYWGERNNPSCEMNVGELIAAWRAQKWPIVYVKHNSTDSRSPLHPDQPGNAFKPVVSGKPDLLVEKSTYSAFFGKPSLHDWLKEHQIGSVAICGIQTNMSCESTARTAVDLGYEVLFLIDATHTFDIPPRTGTGIRGRDISRYTHLQLDNTIAQVIYTRSLLD